MGGLSLCLEPGTLFSIDLGTDVYYAAFSADKLLTALPYLSIGLRF